MAKIQPQPKQIAEVPAMLAYALAGDARFTLVSKKTGVRFTYRICLADDGKVHFVKVLTGSDNETSYSYAAMLKDGKLIQTKKSTVAATAPSYLGIDWFLRLAQRASAAALAKPLREQFAKTVDNSVEFWHSGRCGRCGRTLTVPESVAHGIGPECAKHVFKAEAA
jgi:hypothetical protein